MKKISTKEKLLILDCPTTDTVYHYNETFGAPIRDDLNSPNVDFSQSIKQI